MSDTTILVAVDMLPTLCAAAGVNLPADYAGEGEWRLLIDRSGQRVALFDMAKDRAEKTDVSARNPEVATRMKEQLLKWTQSLCCRYSR